MITGTVTSDTGLGIAGVLVVLEPIGAVATTDHAGAFSFPGLAPGAYSLVLSVGSLETRAPASVAAGETVRVAKTLPADFTFVTSTTVTAASRTPERIVDAPAAVTTVGAPAIALEGASGQIPALLAFTVGADYAQSGLYDINFNTRGFNNLLSRRIQTLVDGRDTAAPESSIQEWYSLGFLSADLESIELVRGPTAALYGANSVNGVMVLKTKAPRDSLGGRARITLGELDTVTADFRWAGSLGRNWYVKALANSTHSESFTRSRTETVEYPGLVKDVVAPPGGGIDANSGVLRFDRYRANGDLFVTEGGFSQSGGETFVAQAGRANIVDVKRGWARAEYSADRWNLAADIGGRSGQQTAMQAGVPLDTSSTRFRLAGQGHEYLASGRVRLVYGASYLRERIDSADDNGRQTLFLSPVTTNQGATFGQLDYIATDRLKLVGAMRWDESSLHGAQVSPKAAAVYRIGRDHSVRVGYNRGFQVGTYTELYLNVPAAPPLDLSVIETALAPVLGGASLGFNVVPVFAIGNTRLDVERIQSLEFGYTGAFGSRARVSVDYYQNAMKDFISDLLPGINPNYPAYRAPATLAPAARAIVEQTVNGALPGLTNRGDGGPQIVFSNANAGRVRSQGIELAVEYHPDDRFTVHANYAWFDFTLKDQRPGAEPQPNAPAHRAAAGVTYRHLRGAASFHYRWVDGFRWASGVYVGPVPSYGVADLNAMLKLSPHWELGLNVSNLFDNAHYEVFGGDLLVRRVLVHPTFSW